jgi:hypothetical protein
MNLFKMLNNNYCLLRIYFQKIYNFVDTIEASKLQNVYVA